jgi:hypothetical protein
VAVVNYKYATFGLEWRHLEYLERTFGHSRMSAGLRAILDEAMEGEEDDTGYLSDDAVQRVSGARRSV